MSALDELQAAGQNTKDGFDSSEAAAADLAKQTEDVAHQFSSLGNDEIAQLLTQSAADHLARVQELIGTAKEELDSFIADCEQAKGGGA